MTNREKMIELLSKQTLEADIEFYDEFVNNESPFRKLALSYTSTRGAYPLIMDKEYKSTEEAYNELLAIFG